jgi:hypothetical protein
VGCSLLQLSPSAASWLPRLQHSASEIKLLPVVLEHWHTGCSVCYNIQIKLVEPASVVV